MKKSGGSGSRTRRCITANFLETWLQFPVASSPANQRSPKSPTFNTSSRRKRAAVAAGGGASASVAAALMESPKSNALASIPDLKHLASSRLHDLKLHVDRSHSEILKDFDSSQSRLHKRFKIQSQACQQVLDEADKEYKKMTQRVTESREAMAASYAEFMAVHRPPLLVVAKHQSLSCRSPLRNKLMLFAAVMAFQQISNQLSLQYDLLKTLGMYSGDDSNRDSDES